MRYETIGRCNIASMKRRIKQAALYAGLTAATILVPQAVIGSQVAEAADLAFIANSGDATVSIIDIATQKELRRIPMLREPDHLGPTPNRKELVVADDAGNKMFFLDPTTGEVLRQVAVADPYQFQFSPDEKFLVVNGLARNQIDIYDPVSMQLVKRFPAPSLPSHLTFSPDSSMVYSTLQGSNNVIAINLKTMAPVWTAPVGSLPAGILWVNGKLIVGVMGEDCVAVMNPADGKVEQKIHTAKGAHNIFFSPDKTRLYVTNRVAGEIVALDTASLKEVGRWHIPSGPDDIAFTRTGKLWITERWGQKVAILDPVTNQVEEISVGRSPHGIYLHGQSN
jgi:DNA-binding beta-propeller fold protein YncE